jgi:hypothetical protein
VTRYIADQKGEIEAVELQNVETGAFSNLEVKCVFVAIGHTPSSGPFKGKIEMDFQRLSHQEERHPNEPARSVAAGDVVDPFIGRRSLPPTKAALPPGKLSGILRTWNSEPASLTNPEARRLFYLARTEAKGSVGILPAPRCAMTHSCRI